MRRRCCRISSWFSLAMSESLEMAVGGYFSTEETSYGAGLPWIGRALAFQSARSAMATFFGALEPTAVWVPFYACSALSDSIKASGARVRRYPLAEGRQVPRDLPMASSDWLICIDYFGLSGNACKEAIDQYGGHRTLVDASQSLFRLPEGAVATVYSPRKFVGIPDGGLLVTEHRLPAPTDAVEIASEQRSAHLKLRAIGEVERGYAAFKVAESSLIDCAPRSMSEYTRARLNKIRFDVVRERRVANYAFVANALRQEGFEVPELIGDAVPLCCPVQDVDARRLRARLVERRIFCASYWEDAALPIEDAIGRALRDRALYLPCDQRYDESCMRRVVGTLLEIVSS